MSPYEEESWMWIASHTWEFADSALTAQSSGTGTHAFEVVEAIDTVGPEEGSDRIG